jgi:hypothetical protein
LKFEHKMEAIKKSESQALGQSHLLTKEKRGIAFAFPHRKWKPPRQKLAAHHLTSLPISVVFLVAGPTQTHGTHVTILSPTRRTGSSIAKPEPHDQDRTVGKPFNPPSASGQTRVRAPGVTRAVAPRRAPHVMTRRARWPSDHDLMVGRFASVTA